MEEGGDYSSVCRGAEDLLLQAVVDRLQREEEDIVLFGLEA